jgi:tetratricopeptide (TPR) repeat protein
MLGVTLIAAASAAPVFAQQTLEERYRAAVQLFNEAKMEDACTLLQQINKESPGYKDVRTYLNPSCDAARRTYEQEESLYQRGVELFKQQQFEEAKQKFSQARQLILNHPKHRTEIDDYLRQIDTRVRDEHLFEQAVQLFNEGRDDQATAQFAQIEQAKGARAADARTYLQRIKERQDAIAQKKATETDQQAFDDAVKAFNNKSYAGAKAGFQSLIQKSSPHSAEARSFLQQIETAQRQDAAAREKVKKTLVDAGKDPHQMAQQLVAEARTDMNGGQFGAAVEKLRSAEILDSANSDVSGMLQTAQGKLEEQPLRLGLAAYFAGQYEEAEKQCGEYLDNHGRKIALALFFRGAAHASRYFLSGELDTQQKDLAMADFRAARKSPGQFQPPAQFVAPKILSMYSQAVASGQM